MSCHDKPDYPDDLVQPPRHDVPPQGQAQGKGKPNNHQGGTPGRRQFPVAYSNRNEHRPPHPNTYSGVTKRRSSANKPPQVPGFAKNAQKVLKSLPDQTSVRGFFLVPTANWSKVEDFLTGNGLEYEYFHASFVNACHKLVRRVDNKSCKPDEWEVRVREILREYPVPPPKYVEALQLYNEACAPPAKEIVGRPIKSTADAEHQAAQIALYCVLFNRKERTSHARERKEAQGLSLAGLLDSLDDVQALRVGHAQKLIDDDNGQDELGGVSLALELLTLDIRGGPPKATDTSNVTTSKVTGTS